MPIHVFEGMDDGFGNVAGPEDAGTFYTEAEVRKREKAAWMNHGEWLYHTLATTGRLPSRDESQAEAERRYGEAKA